MEVNNGKVHPLFRKEKGFVTAFNGCCDFLEPGTQYKDPRGRVYLVMPDGSVHRQKDQEKNK